MNDQRTIKTTDAAAADLKGYEQPAGTDAGCSRAQESDFSDVFPEFQPWPKTPRLKKDMIVTEKLDGTNAQIYITEFCDIYAGSRNRWLTRADDNYGFAAWVQANRRDLLKLGPGRHFGEWWGKGIQRGYGLEGRCFSLFNTIRWHEAGRDPRCISSEWEKEKRYSQELPPCVGLVPVIYRGPFDTSVCVGLLDALKRTGSLARPGFMNPEGIIVYHVAANRGFKLTYDDAPKKA